MVKVGIIGGSGLDDPQILKDPKEILAETPYGRPSSPFTLGHIDGVEVVLLARHGKTHQFSPSQVNNQANIRGLQDEGVTHIIATTACGSLREEIDRGHFVVVDQFIDFTRHRKVTFHESFEHGMEHDVMADPFDAGLREALYRTAVQLGFKTHRAGTMITG